MPNCFSLTRKSDLAAGPVAPQKIDNEIRALYEDCDHDDIAEFLAMIDWLSNNFTTDVWAEVGRR